MTQRSSAVQTGILLGGMIILVSLVGYSLAGSWGLLWGLVFGFGFGRMGQASPELLLRMQGARPLWFSHAPRVHLVYRELVRRAELGSLPSLYVLPSREPVAFAAGAGEAGSAIAVSEGLIRTLSPREMAGVLAHEISHIRNGDMQVLSLAGSIGRLTSFLSSVGQFLLLLNLPLILLGASGFPWGMILLLLVAPVVSLLLQLALSRTKEFEADRGAAELTGDPAGLASALARMEAQQRSLLQTVFGLGRPPAGTNLLRTHPPTEERIRRLMAGGPVVPSTPASAGVGRSAWGPTRSAQLLSSQ